MAKSSGITVRIETWTVGKSKSGEPVSQVKIAVRHKDGRFHGATNFKQKV